MIPFSIGVILRPNTSRKIRSMGLSSKGLRRVMDPYTTSRRDSTWQICYSREVASRLSRSGNTVQT
jgi:hypothetical protein